MTTRVQRTLEDVKMRYEQNKADTKTKESLLGNLENEMRKLTAEKNQLLGESYQHVLRLDGIALKVDSLSAYVYLDFLIEKMAEKGDTEKVQKLKEMKRHIKADEALRAALRYKFGELTVV